MPAPAALLIAKKAVAHLLSSREGKGRGPVRALAAGAAALLFLGASLTAAAPAALVAAASNPRDPSATAELSEAAAEYERKARELASWARERWSSGTGEDSYSTPDWRYLYAFDMAVSGCDEALVDAYEGHYESLHRSLLRASSSVRYCYAEAEEGVEGAVLSEEDGKYYVLVPYTVWTVTYAPLESAFGEISPGTLSEEFRYFALRTGASYADGWTADRQRMGLYRLRAGSELAGFASFAVERDPDGFSMFAPWAESGHVGAGDALFEAAWEKAQATDADAFASLQDDYFAATSLSRASSALRASCGLELASLRECVQGLLAGAAAELSDEELAAVAQAVSPGMSEPEIARAVCAAVSDARPDLSARYLAEERAVADLLASGPHGTAGEGQDPDAESPLLDSRMRAALATNYYASLKTVQATFSGGAASVKVDPEALAEAVSNASATFSSMRAASAFASDVVNAAMGKIGCAYVWGGEGPDGFDCSGLVTWAYRQVGIEVGHYTVTQYGASQIVSEREARPGDLVFQLFGGSSHTPAGYPSHVGIYIGDGKMVHAPTFGALVRVDDVRVFDANPVFGRIS